MTGGDVKVGPDPDARYHLEIYIRDVLVLVALRTGTDVSDAMRTGDTGVKTSPSWPLIGVSDAVARSDARAGMA